MLTALVYALDRDRQPILCRTVLDTGSTTNFISDKLAAALSIPRKKCSIPVGALDNITTKSNSIVSLTIRSTVSNFEKTLTCLTIPRIADMVPSELLPRETMAIPANIQLADPHFYKPAPVDLLLGAGATLSLFSIGQIDLSEQGRDLFLQKTRAGWVVGGGVKSETKSAKCHFADLHSEMNKFWHIEEGPLQQHLSLEERMCEEHYRQNVSRDENGRYIVALPFRQNHGTLGESRSRALKRFQSLENKFKNHPELRAQYTAVIQEYLELGHMSPVPENDQEKGVFLPHHAVIKQTSSTTKVRVVFDGSAKTSSGVSLNDSLMVGPTIQGDIFYHMLRFRIQPYVLTGDIEKMYRQFLVQKEDRQYQRILWKQEGEIKTYELNTVTFGLGAAPFLAIRSLHALADDEREKFPLAADILKKDMYVDDLLTGVQSIEQGLKLRDDIIDLLHLGGLKIRQWASNDSRLLAGIPNDQINTNFQLSDEQTLKTLGVYWNATDDTIIYTAKTMAIEKTLSKRVILTEIAKIFDPLGLLGPVILFAKIIMQKLWQLQLDWDESVPNHIYTLWNQFCKQLNSVQQFTFHRKTLLNNMKDIQLHGFCDASEVGYGACIYLRSTDAQGKTTCQLLCAKSRVAPLKTVSLPRLELCGAKLLAKLFTTVKNSIETEFERTVFWTDSMIALAWINTSPHTLKTFVANRVADIQEKTDPCQWRHVRSQDNPADALSRGQSPNDFETNRIWKNGPSWLIMQESAWPTLHTTSEEIPERKKIICLTTMPNPLNDIFKRFSSFSKLKRVIAYCLRFKINNQEKGPLQAKELTKAEKVIIKCGQESVFQHEIHDLLEGKKVNKKSKLTPLDPFIDKDGLLRVGGRLKNCSIPYNQQHPIILPRSNHITDIIVRQYHLTNLHSGVQTTLYALRIKFWPLDGRNQVRKNIHRCVTCFRVNPPSTDYVMGDLPAIRVTAARPFSQVGVDYCGPFYAKEKKLRNRSSVKVYVAVFICLVVKAVHFEVVSDLTTEAFLGALRRFISRRGKPTTIYSDNGTNLKGANNELKELHELLQSETHKQRVADATGEQSIEWKFTPPLSPHFGGIWEVAVKSYKHHLKRAVGKTLFTFEELYTLTVEIEAILNSRPLTPIPTDPNDILVLTPGHFLIGDSLTSLPQADFTSTPINRLSTWQHLEKLRRDFWSRWYKEYLNELNIRHKWTHGQHQIKDGTIVVLKEDNLPPMQWLLGRVIATHPGSDGIIRTVTVKTAKATYERNIRKLAPLPIDENNDN